ncbi:MAG: phosphatidylglycerophosphatase A [Planctomycetaceae bacterium]
MQGGTTTDADASVPWSAPSVLAATCGGVGRVPIAPGTAGSVLGVPLALATGAAATWAAGRGGTQLAVAAIEACLLAAIVLVGVPICSRAAGLLGRGKDPGAVVYDEFAALPLVLLPVPPAARSLACLAAAFVLFRVFDIAKPFPCRRLERLPAGWGIMADDQAAAAWAAACLWLARSLGLV